MPVDLTPILGNLNMHDLDDEETEKVVIDRLNELGEAFEKAGKKVNELENAAIKVAGAFTVFHFAMNALKDFSVGAFEQFSYILRSVSATIGSALLPIVQRVGQVLLSLANALGPLLEDLGEIIASVVDVLSDLLLPVIQFLAISLDLVAKMLKAMFGGFDAKSIIKAVMDALKLFASTMILLAARLAILFGSPGFAQTIKDTVEKAAKGENVKAPSAQISSASLEQMGTNAAMKSLLAGGAGVGMKSDNAWLEQLAEDLKDLKDGKELVSIIYDGITKWWNDIKNSVGKKLDSEVKKHGDEGTATNLWNIFTSYIPWVTGKGAGLW